MVFHFCFDKTIFTITAKQHICRFLVLEFNIQNMAAFCALQSFVTVYILLFPCMDIEHFGPEKKLPGQNASQKILWSDFWASWKNKSPGKISRKTTLLVLQRNYCALGLWRCIEDIDSRFSREIEKSFCAGKVYSKTLSFDNTRSQRT